MRIGLITREYPPDTCWGGIGTFYAHLATALAEHGHDVHVFTQGLTVPCSNQVGGVTVHRIVPRQWLLGQRRGGALGSMPVSQIGIFSLSLAVAFAERLWEVNRASPFDVIEGHEHLGVNAIANLLPFARYARLTRYHTAYHSLVKRGLVEWPSSRLIRFLESLSITSANTTVAPSEYIDRMTMEDFSVRQATIRTSLLVDLSEASYRSSCSKEPLILFVGRLERHHKNPLLAATAFTHVAPAFPDWRIEFVGADTLDSSGRSVWADCDDALKTVKGRYSYHGQLLRSALFALYARASVLIVPSRFESFGLVAAEAMASGVVPIVASNTALPEVVGNGGEVFENGNLQSLTSSLMTLMGNPVVLQERADHARQRARALCSTVTLSSTISVYKAAIAAGRAGR